METLSSVALPAAVLVIYLALSKRARLIAWASIMHPRREDVLVETKEGPKIVPKVDYDRELAGRA